MSTTSCFFIEVQKKGKWELLYALYPFEDRETTVIVDGKVETTKAKPYVLDENHVGYDRFIKFWKQGSVRDLFNNMMINSPLAKRGLPTDVSDGVKAWFDEQYAIIDKENRDYKEKYGIEKTWGGKWWYNESYATVAELWEALNKSFEMWKKQLLRLFDKKFENCIVMDKLNDIDKKVNLLVKKHTLPSLHDKLPKTQEKEEDNDSECACYEEDIDYMFEDELYDVMNLYAFIQTVEQFAESLTGDFISDVNIRVVTYTD